MMYIIEIYRIVMYSMYDMMCDMCDMMCDMCDI